MSPRQCACCAVVDMQPGDDPWVLRWQCSACRAYFLSHGPVPVEDICPSCGGTVQMTGEVWDMREGIPRWLTRPQADSPETRP